MRFLFIVLVLTQLSFAKELSHYEKKELVRELAVVIQLDKKNENFKKSYSYNFIFHHSSNPLAKMVSPKMY